jgi:hypothetical protein
VYDTTVGLQIPAWRIASPVLIAPIHDLGTQSGNIGHAVDGITSNPEPSSVILPPVHETSAVVHETSDTDKKKTASVAAFVGCFVGFAG